MRKCGTAASPRVADIVAAAGLSNDAFYRHFASKEALVAAILEDGSARLASYLDHQMAKVSTPADKVRRFVEGVMSQAADEDIAATTTRCCGTAEPSAFVWGRAELRRPRRSRRCCANRSRSSAVPARTPTPCSSPTPRSPRCRTCCGSASGRRGRRSTTSPSSASRQSRRGCGPSRRRNRRSSTGRTCDEHPRTKRRRRRHRRGRHGRSRRSPSRQWLLDRPRRRRRHPTRTRRGHVDPRRIHDSRRPYRHRGGSRRRGARPQRGGPRSDPMRRAHRGRLAGASDIAPNRRRRRDRHRAWCSTRSRRTSGPGPWPCASPAWPAR